MSESTICETLGVSPDASLHELATALVCRQRVEWTPEGRSRFLQRLRVRGDWQADIDDLADLLEFVEARGAAREEVAP